MTKKAKQGAPRRVAKPTRAALARAAKQHFPVLKSAAEKMLRDAGLHHLSVDSMTFSVDESAVSGQCEPPCESNESCKLSSTGAWMCVPNA
jgi:hypothetical protein